jgi:hypothetical protein
MMVSKTLLIADKEKRVVAQHAAHPLGLHKPLATVWSTKGRASAHLATAIPPYFW